MATSPRQTTSRLPADGPLPGCDNPGTSQPTGAWRARKASVPVPVAVRLDTGLLAKAR
jgi:hypothetical protein